MNINAGKPDVVELARAQLDFSAMNSASPSSKDILFKAQTIVPMQPSIPWERYATVAGAVLLLCAGLALPWVPQRSLLSIAGLQSDDLLNPEQAQDVVNHIVREMGTGSLLSANFAQQEDGRGMLMIKASSFSQPSSALAQRLSSTLEGNKNLTNFTTYQVAEHQRWQRNSPLVLLQQKSRAQQRGGLGELNPAFELSQLVLASEDLLRSELERELLQHGYQLTGLAFAAENTLLPTGCQFKLHAWPLPLALGVNGYLRMSAFQQAEVQRIATAWLARINLTENGLLLEARRTTLPVTAEVLGQNGQRDTLLTAQLNAAITQPSAQDLTRHDFSVERVVSKAAAQTLPGIERKMDIERLSRMGETPRYLVRITLLGRAEQSSVFRVPDPVDNDYVREEW
jgi:hypothetical protein